MSCRVLSQMSWFVDSDLSPLCRTLGRPFIGRATLTPVWTGLRDNTLIRRVVIVRVCQNNSDWSHLVRITIWWGQWTGENEGRDVSRTRPWGCWRLRPLREGTNHQVLVCVNAKMQRTQVIPLVLKRIGNWSWICKRNGSRRTS